MNSQQITATGRLTETINAVREKKYRELDVMSVLFTLAVLFIHCSSKAVSSLDASLAVYFLPYIPWRLSMAAIQGFVFLSGVKLALTRTRIKSYPAYISARAKKILLPYLAVCVVYMLLGSRGGLIPNLFTGGFDAHLYFVPLIFGFYLTFPLWCVIIRKVSAKIAIPVSFALMLLYGAVLLPLLSRSGVRTIELSHLLFAYSGFFVGGLYVGENYAWVRDRVLSHKAAVISVGASASVLYAILFSLDVLGVISGLPTFLIHSLYCTAVIPLAFLISCVIEKKLFRFVYSDIFKLISHSTYYVYLWHCLIIGAVDRLLSALGIGGVLDGWVVKLLTVPIIAFAASALYISIKNRCLYHMLKQKASKPEKKHLIASIFGLVKFLFNRVFIVALMLAVQLSFLLLMLLRFSDYFVYFFTLTYIMAICLTIYIINKPENPSYKIAWIVPILAMPIFGVALFFIFAGNRMTKRKRVKLSRINTMISDTLRENENSGDFLKAHDASAYLQSKYITNNAHCPPFTGNDIMYFPLGDDMFPRYLDELKKAEKYIFIEYFIIDTGCMWDSVREILIQKVKEGVDVRLIYDDLGTIMMLPPRFAKQLCADGIKTLVWSPFIPVLSAHQNNRDHRKITSIDGKVAFTGGINIADEYINVKEKHGHWKDTAVMVRGEAAWSFTVMFLSMWDYLSNQPVIANTYDHYKPTDFTPENDGACKSVLVAQPYTDSPLDDEKVGESIYLNMINRAEKYLWICTPYLIIDSEMASALILAAKTGVDVRIITPGVPDKKFVHSTTQSFYPHLIENGVKIYEYTPGFIHSKLFICDDRFATVGSVNLDYRSLYLHFECGIWLYDKAPEGIIGDIKRDYIATVAKSHQIIKGETKKQSWLTKCIRAVIVAFAPLM